MSGCFKEVKLLVIANSNFKSPKFNVHFSSSILWQREGNFFSIVIRNHINTWYPITLDKM